MRISDEAVQEAYQALFPQDHAAGPGRMEEISEEDLEEAARTLFEHRSPYSPGSSIFSTEGRREALREQLKDRKRARPVTEAAVADAYQNLFS